MVTPYITRVRVFNNVPFDINYDHTRWFDNATQQNQYFDSLPSLVPTFTALKYTRVERGEVVLKGHKESFVSASYLQITNERKSFYAFVTEILYINEETVKIEFEIDVLQSYMFNIDFKQSFVEREHTRRWNSDGTPVINTVPENLDIGNEYQVINAITTGTNFWNTGDKIMLITSTQKLGSDNTGLAISGGVATPLFHYIFFYSQLPNRSIQVNGNLVYTGEVGAQLFDLFNQLFQTEENANKIVDISFLPFLPLQHTKNNVGSGINIVSTALDRITIGSNLFLTKVKAHFAQGINNYLNDNDIFSKINFDSKITESKLMFYPYSYLNLKDNLGKGMTIKPELNGKVLRVTGKAIVNSVQKVAYEVDTYKGTGSGFDRALVRDFVANIPIVNDYTSTYLQGNKNSLAVKTTTGIVGGIATTALGAMSASTGIGAGIGASLMVGGVSSVFSSVTSLLGKVEDIKNIPDSVEGQGGYATLNIGFNNYGATIDVLRIQEEKLLQIQDYFKVYGYAVKRTKIPNLKTRQDFNYVKTVGANILGNIPKSNLQQIRNIFDKGITLWHTNDMFNYSLANTER